MHRTQSTKVVLDFDSLSDGAYVRQKLIIGVLVPFSASTLWRKVATGEFPAPVKISTGITAWNVGLLRHYLAQIGQTKTGGG